MKSRVEELLTSGELNEAEIARQCNCSRQYVNQINHALGVNGRDYRAATVKRRIDAHMKLLYTRPEDDPILTRVWDEAVKLGCDVERNLNKYRSKSTFTKNVLLIDGRRIQVQVALTNRLQHTVCGYSHFSPSKIYENDILVLARFNHLVQAFEFFIVPYVDFKKSRSIYIPFTNNGSKWYEFLNKWEGLKRTN